jgi:hypothetical protein
MEFVALTTQECSLLWQEESFFLGYFGGDLWKNYVPYATRQNGQNGRGYFSSATDAKAIDVFYSQ